jgi:hypothetical protein
MWKVKTPVLSVVMLLSASVAGRAAAQAAPTSPPGTIAAETQERPSGSTSFGGLIDVTAVSTTLIAFDADGRPVLDLRPDELLVLEDDKPVRLIGLEPGLDSQTTGPPGPGTQQPSLQLPRPEPTDGTQWRVVVYVSTELAGRFVLHTLCRQAAENAGRLTALGPVDVVLADPSPKLLTEADQQPDDVRSSLSRLADSASGATTVDQIRSSFTREFKPGVGFDVSYTITQASPQAMAAKARSSIYRERTIVRRELGRMVAWLQSQPPVARGLLLWMTGGFDLNPSDFYIPLVEQVDHYLAQKMHTDYQALSLNEDVRRLVDVALAYGWTVMPINASKTTFAYGADVEGTGKSQHHMGFGSGSVDAQQGDFQQVAPNYPLQILAHATGGELVVNDNQFALALDHIGGAYLVTYQADHPADGKLHRLEIRCTRPGVSLRGRQFAASGSLRGVAATRGQRILAGENLAGSIDVTAEILNISRAPKGLNVGDLRVSADLGGLRATLQPLDLGEVRVTLVVEMKDGSPFISHQEFKISWDNAVDTWRYGSGVRWPKNARRAAVVVEELVTSTWGAAVVDLD